MVEFGLKLEDNKVDEWYDNNDNIYSSIVSCHVNVSSVCFLSSVIVDFVGLSLYRSSQYIDYEKLKLVLKRAKASVEYRDEIMKRMPSGVVAEVVQERKDRMESAASSARGEKKVEEEAAAFDTIKLGCSPVEESSITSSRSSYSPTTSNNAYPTVTTPLLSNPPKTTSWGSNINHTVFKVTSYLGFADDRILLLQAYDDADDKLQMFEQSYEQEVRAVTYFDFLPSSFMKKDPSNIKLRTIIQVSKVKEFYEEKFNETSQRMEVLIESVETSGLNLNTRHHKRSQSLMESITRKWGSMINHHGNNLRVVREQISDSGPSSPIPNYSGVPDLAKIFSESMDDEDDVQKRKKKEELIRKEDSIKRALTDIYRTAKLLHNYSIMVSLFIAFISTVLLGRRVSLI